MIADTTPSTVGTRICETTAGIPFGKAVSWGSNAKGCILGGTPFFGVRDITLSLAPVIRSAPRLIRSMRTVATPT